MDLATFKVNIYLVVLQLVATQTVASTLALPTSFQTASLKSALGKCFLSAEGCILSEIDSRNGPIKLAYYVTLCSK